ncbi:hypothetical protein BJ741DRAFT_206060 [Chytriomyces cf. hyalinus JEL632]|nr:hypothetical protein BJ741DRAFT_206060 [Chytriomyces cf. hyalinus JEL632]
MLLLTSLLAFTAGTALAGDMTFYNPNGGYGSCGRSLQNGDIIAAMNEVEYDRDPSMCGRVICISHNGRTVRATVEDRCAGCPFGDVDVTPVVFQQFQPLDVGRFGGVSWTYCDGTGGSDGGAGSVAEGSGSSSGTGSGSSSGSSSGNGPVETSNSGSGSSSGNGPVETSNSGSGSSSGNGPVETSNSGSGSSSGNGPVETSNSGSGSSSGNGPVETSNSGSGSSSGNGPVETSNSGSGSSSGNGPVETSNSGSGSSSGNGPVETSNSGSGSSSGNGPVENSSSGNASSGNNAGNNGGLPSCTKGAMSTETCKCYTNDSVIPSNTMCPCSESSDCSASEVCKKYTGQCIPKCTLGQKSTSVCSCSTADASRPFIRAGKVCSCTEDSQCGKGKTCAFGYCQTTSTPADWSTCSDAAQLAKAVLLCAVPDSCNVPCLADPRLLTLRNAKVPTDADLVDFCQYFIDEKNGSFEGCTKTDKAPVENGLDAWVATLKELCHEK